jgi:hypothetical protein
VYFDESLDLIEVSHKHKTFKKAMNYVMKRNRNIYGEYMEVSAQCPLLLRFDVVAVYH